MLRLSFFCVAGLVAGVASAQVYECTDAKGARGYAHFCPPGTVQSREIVKERSVTDEPRGTAREAPKSLDVQNVEFKKREIERKEAEAKAVQTKAEAEEAERNCNGARGQLKAVEDGQMMSRTDPVTGERVFFSDAERVEDMERQRKAIAGWCK